MLPFAFDAYRHEYVSTSDGVILPHVTGMLQETGWIDDRWFTEQSCERGSVVHRLTADYDLGIIPHPQAVTSKYKGWLLGHAKACAIMRPSWEHIEEPMVSERHRYGCRPDRGGLLYGARAVMEVKSGVVPSPARPVGSLAAPDANCHQIQTALQAIVLAEEWRIPAEAIARFTLYLSDRGKFKLEQYEDGRDFHEARRIIRTCC